MTEALPERVRVPDPVGNAFVDYLDVRIAQTLCKEVGRREEGRQLAFAMGLSTARWVYCLQESIENTVLNPVEFVAILKGRLSTLNAESRAKLVTLLLESANYAECRRARRTMSEILAIDE